MENFIFVKNLDQLGNDICRYNNSINELFEIIMNDNNSIGFNTLGFVKNKLDNLSESKYFGTNDGIYIKKEIYKKYLMEKKIRVKMICNWCDSYQLCKEFSNMCKNNYSWNNIEITWENTNIDYYIIINKPLNDEYYLTEKTILFQMEPWVFNENNNWGVKTWGTWAIPDENKFLKVIGRNSINEVNNVYWQLELNYNQLMNLKYENKKNELSSICSSKYFDIGHINRIDFLKYIDEKDDIKLNIFNSNNHFNFKNYKESVLPYINKSNGIVPYKYYFMVENNYEDNFITEKLWEPILCETLCFYYGCPNVDKYIDKDAFVLLDMYDFEKSYNIIKKAIEEDWWSKRIDIIKKEKNRILNEMQFFPRIEKIIYNNELHYYLNNIYESSAWKGHLKLADYLVKKYKPNVVVDLGVDYGHSTFSFAGPGIGNVYGIDWFEGDIHAGLRNTYNIVNDTYNLLYNLNYLPNKNIEFIKGDFNVVAKKFNHKIDILHIDGLHTYEAVKNDFDTWIQKTDYNSIILMHDVISFPNSVGKFFNEINLPKLYFTHSAGLGVISMNKDIILDIYNNYNKKGSTIYLSEQRVNKKNICFIHSCTLNNTKRLEYLINYLKNSNLYNIFDKIYINNIGLNIDINIDNKFELYNYSENNNLFEIPTLNKIHTFCNNNYNEYNILYIHNKGISYSDDYEELNNWIDMMLYFLVDKYELCLNKLLLHDVVGSNYMIHPSKHFSGNYWWATSNYLKKIPKLSEININKLDAEMWLFKNNPNYYEMHNSCVDHYKTIYPKHKYI